MNRQLLSYILVAVVIALLPFLGAYPIFIMKVMCYALFACAFNLLLGFTGLLSFGHAAFMGGAAYATGHALAAWGFPTPVGIIYGVVVAAIMGFVMGAIAIRRSGIYFAMITLAMSQMVFFFFLQAPFTGGEDGLQGIPRGSFFGINLSNDLNLYYLVMACWRNFRRCSSSPTIPRRRHGAGQQTHGNDLQAHARKTFDQAGYHKCAANQNNKCW